MDIIKILGKFSFIVLIICGSSALLLSQHNYEIVETDISITGASSLHDWKVETSEIIDYPESIIINSTGIGEIADFTFKVGVESMDGGRGASMNNKIFKALKSTDHPYVIFTQSEPTTYEINESGTGYSFKSTGDLEIAGQSNQITVTFQGNRTDDHISINGSYPFKLSDFNIDPPSAMFGQIQTKDDITVHFEFKYKVVQ